MGKKLALHICCGPCAIMPFRILLDLGYEITGFFFNPNIHPLKEYLQRRETALECADKFNIPVICQDDWNLTDWLGTQLPRAQSRERCNWCVDSRLKKTYEFAQDNEYAYFSTTLLYSRYQPHDHLTATGKELDCVNGPQFFYMDFRKYWQEGIDLSRQWGLYRQAWCGCVFSETERYAKKLEKLKKSA